MGIAYRWDKLAHINLAAEMYIMFWSSYKTNSMVWYVTGMGVFMLFRNTYNINITTLPRSNNLASTESSMDSFGISLVKLPQK